MKNGLTDKFDNDFYKIMAENFGDELFVTDGKGNVIFVNPAAVEVIGKPVYEIVGKNVEELVAEDYFKPSVTVEVMKQRKTVNMIQTVRGGRPVLVTGVPIFDDNNEEIKMIVSTTKDFEALGQLMDTIEDQKLEISNLRNSAFEAEELITGSDDSEIKKTILKIAPLDMSVLIQGETGVGKEVAAKAIHRFSHGTESPFVKINCGTIPENLMESELFGYEQGAFTGAEKGGKKGKVEIAEGGTLFLDEIGEMPLALQVKLLDFLQDSTFTRVGGTEKRKVNTRVITATNRDLLKMCDEGKFRKDLYYRINVITFEIAPLRERPDDIKALVKYFLSKCNTKYNKMKTISESAQTVLNNYWWPGNVRELEHIIEHAHAISDDDVINEDDFKMLLGKKKNENDGDIVSVNKFMSLKEAKRAVEKQLVMYAYEKYNNTYKVAEALNVDQSTISKILKRIKEEEKQQ